MNKDLPPQPPITLLDVITHTQQQLELMIHFTRLGAPGMKQIRAKAQALKDMFAEIEAHHRIVAAQRAAAQKPEEKV